MRAAGLALLLGAAAGCASDSAARPGAVLEPGKLLVNPRQDPYRVRPPRGLVKGARAMAADLKICVTAEGTVRSVDVERGAHPRIDPLIVEAVQRWRYSPYKVDGKPVPHCYPMKYTFTVLP